MVGLRNIILRAVNEGAGKHFAFGENEQKNYCPLQKAPCKRMDTQH